MLHPTHKLALAVILFGLLLLPNAMWGQKERPSSVKDEVKLFSDKAIEEANSVIAKIKVRHQKDLRIETVEKGPGDETPAKWAQQRAQDAGTDGVYIVISLKPKHFEVYVSPKTRESGLFTIADRDELVKILKSNLGKKSDEALLQVANYTLETMNKRTTVKPASEFTPLVGEWLGPSVDVKIKTDRKEEINQSAAKGKLYLRLSEIRGKPYLDLGYSVPTAENVPLVVFRNYSFELKQNDKERTIVIPYGKKDVVLTYELDEETLKIKASGKLPIPDVAEAVDLSGEWTRGKQPPPRRSLDLP
jgi:hypothetical protein